MSKNEEYADQVRLLIRLLPIIDKEDCFALKGGTAINLFYRNMPRLSVDIDLLTCQWKTGKPRLKISGLH
ncbi:nucleotidyl transferase AbiEii/AbiGii toxin family protein [Arcticibacter tournemirensis]|uniref:nucleotidyl transferase AbiEii/AbiGii toxin family protein n=1 Tax=Arcticibacter tournemirensis TaxID=699437 RepID=UPI00192A5402|nr:nucleotidyl transferase AbiEii/AbiGii toxin family protein [Arcticibacter tournemirensis]